MSGKKTAEVSPVRSLDRGLHILDSFMNNHMQTLTEVANKVELPKSTVYRLLTTLQLRGYITDVEGESGTYRIGVKGIWFTSVRNRIHHQLSRLQSLTGETTNFGAIVGTEIEYIDRVISDHSLRWGVDVGSRVQLYCSGMGKAVLAFREDLIPEDTSFMKYTGRTVSDLVELQAQLKVVHHRGFAVDDEEFIDGVFCIAAPVRNETGQVVGAVSVSGPSVRFSKDIAFSYAPQLLETAQSISNVLGFHKGDTKEEL